MQVPARKGKELSVRAVLAQDAEDCSPWAVIPRAISSVEAYLARRACCPTASREEAPRGGRDVLEGRRRSSIKSAVRCFEGRHDDTTHNVTPEQPQGEETSRAKLRKTRILRSARRQALLSILPRALGVQGSLAPAHVDLSRLGTKHDALFESKVRRG